MRSPGWTRLTLLACAAAGTASAQVAQPPETASDDAGTPQTEWRVPPLKVSGSLVYDARMTRSTDEPRSLSQLVTANVRGSTYLYQPWLATVDANVGLSSGWSSTGGATGSTDAALHERIRTRDQFVSGGLRVDYFPRSRFPGDVHFERVDSRTDSNLLSAIDFRRQSFGMSQRYAPAGGPWDVLGTFEHRTQDGLGIHSTQDSLQGQFNTRWKSNDVTLSAAHSRAADSVGDDESRFTSLVGRHAYVPNSELSVNTTANVTRTEDRGGGFSGSDLQVLQVSSVGLYHEDESPVSYNGSLRALALREGSTGSYITSFGATAGANYTLSPQVQIAASGGVGLTRTPTGNSSSFSGSVSASYQGETLEFRGINYNWFSTASLSASLADREVERVTQNTLGLQIGHSASRSWQLTEANSLSLNASQRLATTYSRTSEDLSDTQLRPFSSSLLNTVAASWQNRVDSRAAQARVSYSDSLELGGGHARFQLLTFQLSGMYELGNGASVFGDLSYTRTSQRTSTFEDKGAVSGGASSASHGISADISYQQNRLFGVPRLRFSSHVRLAQDVLKQPGQLVSIPDRETRLWENRLEWGIGRIDAQLSLRVSQVDSRRIDSLWLRVRRSFSN